MVLLCAAGFLALRAAHAQDSFDFDSTASEYSSNFIEQGIAAGTTFGYSATAGINGSGCVTVAGSPDAARYLIAAAGFSAPGTGYAISFFFKARTSTGGVSPNLSVGTSLTPSTADLPGVNSGTNAYLMAYISAVATLAGTPTQFQVGYRSRDGVTVFGSPLSSAFTLTNGNWYKFTTVYTLTASGQFTATATVEDYGAAGISSPTTIISYAGTPLANSRFVGAPSVWAGFLAGAPTGAGTNVIDQFSLDWYPDLASTQREFPSGADIINVKAAPYNAHGDGITDDTAAIQSAITNNQGILYFPNGTYLVSNTLFYKNSAGNGNASVTLQGESRNGTIIRLKNSCAGYTSASTPKAVIYTASQGSTNPDLSGDQAFRNSFCNLTIDVGQGNAGAIGIDYLANNVGAIRNVRVKSSDPAMAGYCGISANRPFPGPCLIKNVEIDGFATAIITGYSYISITFENIVLVGQTSVGIVNSSLVLAIRNLSSTNTVPVIKDVAGSSGVGSLIILDKAELKGGSPANDAIEVTGSLYLRDVYTHGYNTSALRVNGMPIAGPNYTEYSNPPGKTLFSLTPQSLRLPVEQTPVTWDNTLSHWVVLGASNGSNDTAAIQAAIDSAPAGSTLSFSSGVYFVADTIHIRNNIAHIVGLNTEIDAPTSNTFTNPSNPKPVFRFETPAASISGVTLEGLFIRMSGITGAIAFEDASAKPVTIQDTMMFCGGGAYRNVAGSGKLFLEDFGAHGHTGDRVYLNYPQQVWARQLDIEPASSNTLPMVANAGGILWILGFKTEQTGTFIATTAGGQTELFGAYNYINGTVGGAPIPLSVSAYSCIDSEEFLSFATDGGDPSAAPGGLYAKDYVNYVTETEGPSTLNLTRSQTYGRYGSPSNFQRVLPLFGGPH